VRHDASVAVAVLALSIAAIVMIWF
jgi:hypothetical protein